MILVMKLGSFSPLHRDPCRLVASAQNSANYKRACTSGHKNVCYRGAEDDVMKFEKFAYKRYSGTCDMIIAVQSVFVCNRNNHLVCPVV